MRFCSDTENKQKKKEVVSLQDDVKLQTSKLNACVEGRGRDNAENTRKIQELEYGLQTKNTCISGLLHTVSGLEDKQKLWEDQARLHQDQQKAAKHSNDRKISSLEHDNISLTTKLNVAEVGKANFYRSFQSQINCFKIELNETKEKRDEFKASANQRDENFNIVKADFNKADEENAKQKNAIRDLRRNLKKSLDEKACLELDKQTFVNENTDMKRRWSGLGDYVAKMEGVEIKSDTKTSGTPINGMTPVASPLRVPDVQQGSKRGRPEEHALLSKILGDSKLAKRRTRMK